MPTMQQHWAGSRTRIMMVGDPGSGKTSALAGLAEAGEELFILDFDNGLEPLFTLLSPEAAGRVRYETLLDPVSFDLQGTPTLKGPPQAFARFAALMRDWKDSETGESFGPPESWPSSRWLIIDTLSSMGEASMWHTLARNQRLGKRRRISDWGDAIARVEGALQMFRSLPINLIVLTHLMTISPDEQDDDDKPGALRRANPDIYQKRFPSTVGRKLPQRIGGYFSCIVQARQVGKGRNARRVISTTPDEDVDIKVPALPSALPAEVPIDGLMTIIEALRKHKET